MKENKKMTLNQRTAEGAMPTKKKDLKQIDYKDISLLLKYYRN